MRGRNILLAFVNLYLVQFVFGQYRFGCEDFCETKKEPCPEFECSNGRIAQNATQCGCCDLCVEYLKINEVCQTQIIGQFPRQECGPNLACDEKTHQCVPIDSKCTRHQKASRIGDIPVMNTQVTCDEYGAYDPITCISDVLCYCVDKNGDRIFGTDFASRKDDMHCNCSREFVEFPKSVPDGAFLRCLPNGNYDTLQCSDEWCYCMQDVTRGFGQTQNTNESLENLICYDANVHKGYDSSLMSGCEKERQRLKEIIREYEEQNISTIGVDLPRCELDGSHASVQCEKDECYCVDEKGQSNNYRVKRDTEEAKSMNCRCARDKELVRKETHRNANMELFLHTECSPNGNY